MRSLVAEGRALAALDHPHIARVQDVLETSPPALVMEFVEGSTLEAWLKEGQPAAAVLAAIHQIVDAVAYAHRRGIVHCDIKPRNVLVTPESQVKIIDFGIALMWSVVETVTSDGTRVKRYTPRYAAPEVVRGATPTRPSDVYSLGVLIDDVIDGCREADAPLPAPLAAALAQVARQARAADADARPRDGAALAALIPADVARATSRAHWRMVALTTAGRVCLLCRWWRRGRRRQGLGLDDADHCRRAESRCRRVLYGLGWRSGSAQGRTRAAHQGTTGQGRGAALPGQRARPRQAAARSGPVARPGSNGRAFRFGGPHERGHLPGPGRDHREDHHPSWPARCHGHAGSRGGRSGADLARRTLTRVARGRAGVPAEPGGPRVLLAGPAVQRAPGPAGLARTGAIAAGAGRGDAAGVRRGARRTGESAAPAVFGHSCARARDQGPGCTRGGAATGRRPRGRAPRSSPWSSRSPAAPTRPCRTCTACSIKAPTATGRCDCLAASTSRVGAPRPGSTCSGEPSGFARASPTTGPWVRRCTGRGGMTRRWWRSSGSRCCSPTTRGATR